jgi:hypothetical protein
VKNIWRSHGNAMNPAILEVLFLLYLMFLYDQLLNMLFQAMISDQKISPKSFRTLRKQAESSCFSMAAPDFEHFQSAFLSKHNFLKINQTSKIEAKFLFLLCVFQKLEDRKLRNLS